MINQNFYETELRKVLHSEIESQRIRVFGDSTPFFEQLAKFFPAKGSKIDWGQVPNSINRVEKDEVAQVAQFIKFFDEIVCMFRLSGDVFYLGDSATDFVLASKVDCIRDVLPDLLAIPQHHYLVNSDYAWCMCFTMEGDMGFGFCP